MHTFALVLVNKWPDRAFGNFKLWLVVLAHNRPSFWLDIGFGYFLTMLVLLVFYYLGRTVIVFPSIENSTVLVSSIFLSNSETLAVRGTAPEK
jgi:hypothetical protein